MTDFPASAVDLRPGCKVNFHLDILRLREDGYHELRTLFVPLPVPGDTLRVSEGSVGSGLKFGCSDPELEGDGNIVVRAYQAFAKATGFAPDIEVFLTKRVPHGAGLGGGSADAAALLLHLNGRARDAALNNEQLNSLAADLGADVPFFLLEGPALAEGIGEKLTPVDLDLRGVSLVLCCPGVHVSTPEAFRAWDAAQDTAREKGTPFLTSASHEYNFPTSFGVVAIRNSFEPVIFERYPELRLIKEQLAEHGAYASLMSGSGSSVFGLFHHHDRAQRAAETMAGQCPKVFVHKFL